MKKTTYVVLTGLLLLVLAGFFPAQTTQTFTYTGLPQSFTVPSCVSELTIEARGAQGGNAGMNGGNGGVVRGVLNVVPGQILNVFVGGQGGILTGGFNGGGAGGGLPAITNGAGGGGASDIRIGGTGLHHRVLVGAGGGGGGGTIAYSPAGGVGGAGSFCSSPYGFGGGGGGGCAIGGNGGCAGGSAPTYGTGGAGAGLNSGGNISGGAFVLPGPNGVWGTAGFLGGGGNGGNMIGVNGAGGGGGGYYGGAGGMSGDGGCNGGGGGGSSYADNSILSNITFTAGGQTGNGLVTISYNLQMPLSPASGSLVCYGFSQTLSAASASGYTWSTGANSQSIVITPTVSSSYTVTSISAASCITSSVISVVVNPNPTVSVSSSTNAICNGGSLTLNGVSAGNAVNWYTVATGGSSIGTSASGANFTVSPVNTTTYYAAASTSSAAGSQTLSYTGNVQTFVVPPGVRFINIDVRGSQGGSVGGYTGGLGARISGGIPVTPGQALSVIVGGQGVSSGNGAPGGGATAVLSGTNLIAVAGGGGGASAAGAENGKPGQITPFGGNSSGMGGYYGRGGDKGFVSGDCGWSSGGGGYLTNGYGGDGSWDGGYPGVIGNAGSGRSFLNGGAGGLGGGCQFDPSGSGGYGFAGGARGEFGGGGGGGYSGGGGGQYATGIPGTRGGGGGGSFSQLFNQSNTAGFQTGNGEVIFSWVIPGGCESVPRAAIVVTVNALPTVTATASSSAICLGQNVTLTGSGASTYTWTSGVTNGTPFSPASTNSYSLTGRSAAGCASSNTAVITVTVDPLPAVSVTGNNSVCAGSSLTLTANGANTYTWSNASNASSVAVSPAANTTYTLAGTNTVTGCSNTATHAVTITPLPNVTANSGTVCSGSPYTLAGGGANSYTYSGGSNVVTPTITSSYTITGQNLSGCTNTAVATVTVRPRPLITASSGSICSGGVYSILTSGASSYTITGGSFNVSPPTTTSYSVTGTSSLGCVSATPAVATVTVHARPTITVNSGAICSGNAFTINPSGASTYTVTGGNFTVFPVSNTSYSVTGTSSLGCLSSNTAVASVTVNPLPFVTASSGSTCAGNTFVIVPGGASNYNITGNSFTVSPSITTSYSVTGTSTAGCASSNTAVATVTAIALPTITAASGSICSGNNFSIVPGGANTYTITGGSFNVSPPATNSYSVSGTSTAGCVSASPAIVTVTVYSLPPVGISSASYVCTGSSTTLMASGANSYLWNTAATNNTISVAPAVNTMYSVTGTDLNGCQNTASVNIAVVALPVVSGAATDPDICAGESTTLNGSGASTYTWSGGVSNGVPFSPAATSTYTLSGTSAAGCTSTNNAVVTVTVNLLPVITASVSDPEICPGETIALTASGASTYTWNGGFNSNTPFAPAATSEYTVNGTDVNGCSNSAVTGVTVHPLPVVSAILSDSAVCINDKVTFNGAGALTYTWSQGIVNGAAYTATASGTYSVAGTSSAGCTSTNVATVSLTVFQLPVVSVIASETVLCAGDTATLRGSGASTYTWSGGVSDNVAFIPANSSNYIVSGTDLNGCVNSSSVELVVNALPLLSASSASQKYCPGETATLTLSGAVTYTWSDNSTGETKVIAPLSATSYSASGTDANGCTNEIVYTYSVLPCGANITSNITTTHVSCDARKDGRLEAQLSLDYPQYSVKYIWTPASICADSLCAVVDSVEAGTYSLTMIITYTVNSNYTTSDTVIVNPAVIKDENGPCLLQVYSGVTPNNDGRNDIWYLENIDRYPKNRVSIYNRWGKQIFDTNGYNNTDKYWPTAKDLETLTSSTYFYIIEPGDGGKPVKGWVELIKSE